MSALDFDQTHHTMTIGEFGSLDEMEPSLVDGFHVIYDREVTKLYIIYIVYNTVFKLCIGYRCRWR